MTNPCFPEKWIEQISPLLGPDLPDFLRSMAEPPVRGARMRGSAPPDALDEIPWAENARYLPLDSQAGASPLHEAGAYYLQEPSAMVPFFIVHSS